ncbi:hypothetical protein KP509_36G041700 [Ceratopteris richardii]|uniref:Pre-rRNA-processing protein TSR2 homolog n=1 Tax=Ceratopteris richardii TaxID=49495 RepID=A0A8T2QBX6_CERRI|nr:hypothetical protein KP509_36G041700 [Ceratopteris richardii]
MELRSGTVMAAPGLPTMGSASDHLSEEGAALFHQGVGLVLSRWTALQLAIHNEWGGHSSHLKAQQLHNEVFEFLLRSKAPRCIDELEDLLDENLVQQFNTEAEDGSLEEVAEKLMSMYEECLEGRFEAVNELIMENSSGASQSASKSLQVEADIDEEDVDLETKVEQQGASGMDVDNNSECNASQMGDEHTGKGDGSSSMDESNGWQMVSSKSKRKPRKK